MNKHILSAALILSGLFSVSAQQKDKQKWDVNTPPGDFTQVEISTDEGTWMNLDVSPDGTQLVFDMLGDIYTLPVTGGQATLVREGHAFEVQPRFSPDGKKISFTSDAGGGDNIWIMNTDGSQAKQVTKENFRLLNNAVWMPDGQFLIARKHFTSSRSLGAGELWMYHISGGEGMQLTKKKNDQQDLGEPCVSPDGRYVYFSEDMYPGGYFQYNKDPNAGIYAIKRYDREKGEIEFITGGTGGAVRPQISRDGKLLAFVKRIREKSVLVIHNLSSGEEWVAFSGLSKDQQEAWAIFGVYTNFNWLPDNKSVVIWSAGKLWKINTEKGIEESKRLTAIPFTAKAQHKIVNALRYKQDVAPETFTSKAIRQAITSPDGKILVFNAAGYLYKKDLPNGKPSRLTNETDFEFEPSFSSDGKEIIFVSWNDEKMGSIKKVSRAGGKVVTLTKEKAIYRMPKLSSDGKSILYLKEEGNEHQGFTHCVNPGIYSLAIGASEAKLVSKEGFSPFYSADGKRIFFQAYQGADKALKSVDLSGNDAKVHYTSKYANSFVPSPDNKWIAFTELYKVYITPFMANGKMMELTSNSKALPVTQVARDCGVNLHWSGDSKKIHWTLGDEYFTNSIADRFTFLSGLDSIPPMDTAGIKIGLELKTDKPTGIVVFKGARIVTMKGDEVIENGTVIIENNRIKQVGKDLTIPAGAKVIDVTGKTIIPGIVDVHAHLGTFRQGLSPQKQWSYYANLAYGITTTHDPSSNSEMVFSQSEMVKTGAMVGPRIFSTGTILYGADGDFKAVINSRDDARGAIYRTKAFGAFSVKSYNQPRREQRQQVISAARDQNVMVVPEGGSTFFHNMTHVLDGHTGVEHNIPMADAHNDVVKLWSASKVGYTPTLIVAYGAVNGEYYFYQHSNVWEKSRLLNFTPRFVVDSRSRHRTMLPEAEYTNGHIRIAKHCKKLLDAGVKVNLGSHGQLQGLGAHWELWMLSQGGMTNIEALRCATMNGAHYIGMDHEIGSLEAGKLADLVVLDKNPLDDIRNTEFVKYTMVNGKLFDAETMNELGNGEKKRTAFFWEIDNSNQSYPSHSETHGADDACGIAH